MTSNENHLQASSPFPSKALDFAGHVRKAPDYLCANGLIFAPLEHAIQRHLLQHQLPSYRGRAERYLIIQGEPGTGKSVAACDASLRFGFAVGMLPASSLASEHEGGATLALDDFLTDMETYSRKNQQPAAIVIDDFDLSICGTDSKTGRTINTNLLEQRLQFLADNRDHYCNWDGSCIPIICTGNDFTPIRGSLFRDGRATWYTHAPTVEEKYRIASRLFNPQTPDEQQRIEGLVELYRNEPVSFFTSLHNDLVKQRFDAFLGRGFPDIAAVEAELAKPIVLDDDQLSALASARATTKALGFL